MAFPTIFFIFVPKFICRMEFQRNITLSNSLDELPRLKEVVDAASQAAGFGELVTNQMNLVVEEAVVNVIDYGYPAGAQGDIQVRATLDDGILTFVLIDRGVPFDPTTREPVDTTLPAEERPIGGLGIFMMQSLMDSIDYERIDEQNVLTLRKKIKR